jgi:60 kDa SS-A/Ro ribonucleoprotein
MNRYVQAVSPKNATQTEFTFGRDDQVRNNAGGVVFGLTPIQRLRRFLILGSEGNTFYQTERELTKENAEGLADLIAADGPAAVREIVAVSTEGRAPKNDPAIFALALCAKLGDETTRRMALDAMPKVCRTGTHLFAFAEAVQAFGGWGRGTRKAFGRWYAEKDPKQLAYQVTKYQQRNGWSHRDIFRLTHPKALPGGVYGPLYTYIVKGTWLPLYTQDFSHKQDFGAYMDAVQEVKAVSIEQQCLLVRAFDLPREVLPSESLNDPRIWEALLDHMPMEAMLRNLATMTRIGLIAPNSDGTRVVMEKLENAEAIKRSRLHPIAIIKAMMQYGDGRGLRSTHTWTPVQRVVDALDAAFYTSFGNIVPSGKRYGLFLDVSGSMDGGTVAGVPNFTPRVASSTMAMVTARSEKQFVAKGFTADGGYFGGKETLTDIPISSRSSLADVARFTNNLPMGRTDCAQPMLWAMTHKVPVDVFVLYTDSETYAGLVHPNVALRNYRQKMGIDAKLIVVGMTSTGFTIADPKDPGMLDVVGFDTAAPQVMSEFALGRV